MGFLKYFLVLFFKKGGGEALSIWTEDVISKIKAVKLYILLTATEVYINL